MVGALLGVAGFAADQTHSDWRPQATRTAVGWRVTQPSVGVNEPSLAGDHLAWQAGTYTVAMDLRSGKARLLGNAADPRSLTPPVVSSSTVVWVADAPGTRDAHRRLPVRLLVGPPPPPVADERRSGHAGGGRHERLLAEGPGQRDRGRGLRPRERAATRAGVRQRSRLVPAGRRRTRRLVAPDAAVVALRDDDARHSDGATTDLALPGQTSGAIFATPILAGDTLAWLRTDAQGRSTISTYDLRDLSGRQIAAGRGLVGPGFDGATVVWAQPAASGGEDVMGLRLSGGPAFRIARVTGAVQSVMVSGDRAAWWVGTGPNSWIGVSRLPA